MDTHNWYSWTLAHICEVPTTMKIRLILSFHRGSLCPLWGTVRTLDKIMRSSLLKNMACRFTDNAPLTSFSHFPPMRLALTLLTRKRAPRAYGTYHDHSIHMYTSRTEARLPSYWSLLSSPSSMHNAALTVRDCLVFVGCG